MKKSALCFLAVAMLLAPAMLLRAKDAPATPEAAVGMKSVAVISIANYKEIVSDVAFLGELAGAPGLDQQLDGMIKIFTQGQGLKGLDQSKPWGITVQTDGMQFQPLIFLPVKNLKDLLGALGQFVGEPEDQGDGVLALQAGPQKVFAKESSGWAYLGQTAESLAKLPKDPVKLLAGLEKQYDIALRLNVQNVPEMYRTMAVDQIKAGIEQGLQKQEDEDDDTYAMRKKMMEAQMDQMTRVFNETSDMTFGWLVDREKKSSNIDIRMTAIAGSKMAEQISRIQEQPSEFAGFVQPSAAVSLNFVTKSTPEDAEQAILQIDALAANAKKQIDKDEKLSDAATKQVAKSILADVMDAVKATLKGGKMDAGASLTLEEKEFSLIAGIAIAEPMKIEGALKKLVELAKKDKNFPAIKFDAAKHAGVRFHTLTVPIPQDEDIAKVLGDKLDIAVGIGKRHVYLAVGADGLKDVQGAIDGSVATLGKKMPPARLTIALASIFKFAAAVSPNPAIEMMAEELAKSDGKDHVVLLMKPEATGSLVYRLTLEEGVLRLIGQASKLAGGGGGAQGAGPPGFGN